MLRHILFIFSLLISSNLYAQNKDEESKPVSMDSLFRMKARESIGKSFPEFKVSLIGKTITKDSLKGKIVFINFWFEACPPCIAELPALNKLYEKFGKDKNFEFVSFTYEKPAKIVMLKKKYGIKYKVASVSNQECYRLNQNNGFPTSIVLDADGTIADLFTGGDTDRRKAAEFIRTAVYQRIGEQLQLRIKN